MDVQDLWQLVWDHLIRALHDKKHRFRTATISTVSKDQLPNARTVVLRAINSSTKSLRFYTDCASAKMMDLKVQPITHWLFWDPKSQLQFSASGPSTRLSDAVTASIFSQLPKYGRKSYATKDAPGTSLTNGDDGLPMEWEHLSLAETDYAVANFCVLETQIDTAEILYLNRSGHRRLSAKRQINDEWHLEWVVP